MKKRTGFTLVELLAVIVILVIVLAIAIPSVMGIIKSSKKSSFENDANLIIRATEQKKLSDKTFDPETVTEANIKSTLGIDPTNYEDIKVTVDQNDVIHVELIGSGKFNGLQAGGTVNNITVTNIGEIDYSYTLTGNVTKEGTSGSVLYSFASEDSILHISSTGDGEIMAFNDAKWNYADMGDLLFDKYANDKLVTPLASPYATRNRDFDDNNYVFIKNLKLNLGLDTVSEVASYLESYAEMTYSDALAMINTVVINLFGANGPTIYNNAPLIRSVQLGQGLVVINQYAFRAAKITAITIPSSVTSISNGAFYDTNITSVTIQGTPATRFNSNWENIGFPLNQMPQ